MVFDHVGVTRNPARDRVRVRLAREERPEIQPPTAEHVDAVHALLAPAYRLPLLVLDATGMRIGELEQLTWGDVDEPRGRWRVSAALAKTRRARWVSEPPPVFAAVTALVAREIAFLNVASSRASAPTGSAPRSHGPVAPPASRRSHRTICATGGSLLHLAGVPWARIGEHVGQRDLAVTANTYTHVLLDEAELDYPNLLV